MISRRFHAARTLFSALAAIAATVSLAACGAGQDTSTDSGSSAGAASTDITQQTVTPGKLTVATGQPAYTPWVVDDDPASGEGYESAVIYALADKLGFAKDDVVWTRTTFDAAIAPGAKDWDLNIQQFSITDERRNAVDFSPSYYNATQSIVVRTDGKYADATSLDDLKDATIGAMVGTTSYEFAEQKLGGTIQAFNDNATLAQALDSNQLDAVVFDTPTCVNVVRSSQVKKGKVLGQIPGSEDPEGTGIVLPKGSALTSTVTDALNELEADGTLKQLQDKWLAEYTTDVPVLK